MLFSRLKRKSYDVESKEAREGILYQLRQSWYM